MPKACLSNLQHIVLKRRLCQASLCAFVILLSCNRVEVAVLFLRDMEEAREHCRQTSVLIVDVSLKNLCCLGDRNEVIVGY